VGASTSLAQVLRILVPNFLNFDPDWLHATGQTRLVLAPSACPQILLLACCACLPLSVGAALGLPPPWAIPWFLFAIAKTFGAVNDIIGVSMPFPTLSLPLSSPLLSLDCPRQSLIRAQKTGQVECHQKHQAIANTVAWPRAVLFAGHGAMFCGIPSVPGRTLYPQKSVWDDALGFFSTFAALVGHCRRPRLPNRRQVCIMRQSHGFDAQWRCGRQRPVLLLRRDMPRHEKVHHSVRQGCRLQTPRFCSSSFQVPLSMSPTFSRCIYCVPCFQHASAILCICHPSRALSLVFPKREKTLHLGSWVEGIGIFAVL
jgi:hypothetical protein